MSSAEGGGVGENLGLEGAVGPEPIANYNPGFRAYHLRAIGHIITNTCIYKQSFSIFLGGERAPKKLWRSRFFMSSFSQLKT